MSFVNSRVGVKVLRALLAGSSAFVLTYLVPTLVFPEETVGSASQTMIFFSSICVFFSFAGELTRDTLAFFFIDIARGLTMIYFFGSTASAGGLSFQIPMNGALADINIDLSILMLIVIALSLFDISRSLVKAVHYYIKKREAEEIMRLFYAYMRKAEEEKEKAYRS